MNLEELTSKYIELSKGIYDNEKYNFIQMSFHSTAIEGGTLTAIETEEYLEKGAMALNKPLSDHLMVKDHRDALVFILSSAAVKMPVTTCFIQCINAHVMANTGQIYNTSLGNFDSSKGDLILLNV